MVDTTTAPYITQPEKKKSKTKMIAIIAVVIIAVLIGLFMFLRSRQSTKQETTTTETATPIPSPSPKIDKSTVKIQVQNGTGTPGQASTAVDAIVKAGYNADNIKTANAENFDTTVTTITAKAGFESVASDIKDALKDTFDEIKIDSTELASSSDFDIVVVTGGKKFEAATPKPTSPGTTTSPTSTAPSPTTALTPTPTP